MNKVKIITDSTASLKKELCELHNIDVVPLNVCFGDETYKDGVDIDLKKLLKLIDEKGQLPKTAAPSPNDFSLVFRKYIDLGCDIIFLGLSSHMSTTFQNANIAKQEFPKDRIYIVDSLNLSSGIGVLLLKASKLASEGKSAKEIKEILEELVPKVSSKFAVDTLEYLHKGGRCSSAAQLIGHILHIHPIISVKNGTMIVSKKVRGPMKIAINEMINELKEDLPNVDTDYIFITYSPCDETIINYFYEEASKLVDKQKIILSESGCVIGSHCGPGTIGILYIKQ